VLAHHIAGEGTGPEPAHAGLGKVSTFTHDRDSIG
jgi:hypothetical protein